MIRDKVRKIQDFDFIVERSKAEHVEFEPLDSKMGRQSRVPYRRTIGVKYADIGFVASCRNADDVPESWHIAVASGVVKPDSLLITNELSP